MDNLATVGETLAEWVVELKLSDIPSEYIASAKNNILDMIGCGLFGSTKPWVRIVAEMVIDWGGKEESAIWGRNKKVPSVNAVFANANAVNSFEYDDTYVPYGIHPGAFVVTSALAAAEVTGGITGSQIVEAVVAGQEVSVRARRGLGWSVLHGWNGTAICSTFGAAVAASKIMGHSVGQTADALGITGPYVGGLLTYGFSAMAKRVVNARSAQGGFMAAVLAQRGFTGYRDIFESQQGGFCTAHSPDCTIEKITEKLGSEYQMQNLVLKKYPNCTSFHAVADSLSGLILTQRPSSQEIDRVVINTTSGALKNNVGASYDNISSAQMSMQYAVAALLLDGELGIEQFTEERVNAQDMRQMVSKIETVVDPELEKMGLDHRMAAKVDIHLKDGTKIESEYVRRPRVMSSTELDKKFLTLSTKTVPLESANEIMGIVKSLEKCDDVSMLTKLLEIQ